MSLWSNNPQPACNSRMRPRVKVVGSSISGGSGAIGYKSIGAPVCYFVFFRVGNKKLGLFWYLVKPLGGGMEAGASGLHYERGRS